MTGPVNDENNIDDYGLELSDNINLRHNPVNLQQKRVQANPSIEEHFNSANKLQSEVKRPSFGNDDDKGYMPLNGLNSFQHDWTICVKVT